MAQELKSINLVAPGFKGINTEDSPLSIDPNFAAIADNCVIDRYGRIAARKGYQVLTTDKTELGTAAVEVIHVFKDSGGNTKIFSCGNNKILSGTTTLVDETPALYTITANNWDVVNFNDSVYFFQRGHEPLVYSNSSAAVEAMSDVSGAAGTPPEGNVVIASWGRLWVADFANDKSTIYWSDLLQGHVWSGGSSGSIDISKVWPAGYDEITGLAAYNNQLIIFGKNSIVVYEGADSPATMALQDTVAGIGMRCRCGIVDTGTDLLFLSYDGLRSFGRTIQEKSMPIGDLSRNIKQDLLQAILAETEPVRMEYSPENSFVLLAFRSQSLIYAFDVRGTLENGSYRVTRWPASDLKALYRNVDGVFYLGTTDGVCIYSGYLDGTKDYIMSYYSPNLTFGDSSRLKILKKLRPTVIGGSLTNVNFKWGYDFSGNFKTFNVSLPAGSASEFGVDEYAVGEYGAGIVSSTININTTGDGASVVVGMEADIEGSAMSLQEYNIWSMVGKLV
jgi:hypothetical protein